MTRRNKNYQNFNRNNRGGGSNNKGNNPHQQRSNARILPQDEASINESTFILAKNLENLKDLWKKSFNKSTNEQNDPLISNDKGREFFFEILDIEFDGMKKSLIRTQGKQSSYLEKNSSEPESSSQSYREKFKFINMKRNYDPPGNLSELGPRHDNDFEDFTKILIAPTKDEILCVREPFIPTFNIPGNNQAVNQTKIREYYNDGGKFNHNGGGLYVYSNIKFENISVDRRCGFLLKVSFKQRHMRSSYDRRLYWRNSKKLMNGSLICLLLPPANDKSQKVNDQYSFFFGIVASRDESDLSKERAEIGIELIGDSVYPIAIKRIFQKKNTFHSSNFMVEPAGVFFEAYYHVLKTIQSTRPSTLPFVQYLTPPKEEDELMGLQAPVYAKAPDFYFDLSALLENKSKRLLLDVKDPNSYRNAINELKSSKLDDTQAEALVSSLCREIALIQDNSIFGQWLAGRDIDNAKGWIKEFIPNWEEPNGDRPIEELIKETNVWQMSMIERVRLFNFWTDDLHDYWLDLLYQYKNSYEIIAKQVDQIYIQNRHRILADCHYWLDLLYQYKNSYEIIAKQLPCGHTYENPKCYEARDLSLIRCQKIVKRTLPNCGHEHKHRCYELCGDNCEKCLLPIDDFKLPCGHTYKNPKCYEAHNCEKCLLPIDDFKLPCGHTYKNPKCYEARDLSLIRCRKSVNRVLPNCGHENSMMNLYKFIYEKRFSPHINAFFHSLKKICMSKYGMTLEDKFGKFTVDEHGCNSTKNIENLQLIVQMIGGNSILKTDESFYAHMLFTSFEAQKTILNEINLVILMIIKITNNDNKNNDTNNWIQFGKRIFNSMKTIHQIIHQIMAKDLKEAEKNNLNFVSISLDLLEIEYTFNKFKFLGINNTDCYAFQLEKDEITKNLSDIINKISKISTSITNSKPINNHVTTKAEMFCKDIETYQKLINQKLFAKIENLDVILRQLFNETVTNILAVYHISKFKFVGIIGDEDKDENFDKELLAIGDNKLITERF
ncbi:8648_t:CDS:10 [Entrophospora sp. SA101]|nr:8648_t:CDS:10 [Entrophospora sp. SA101]